MPIERNSFIQMSKLTNLKGRINYISSPARQENLYAVYETTDRNFWDELAKCNQTEFVKSGTTGKCIEARELIIALPEDFIEYPRDVLLKLFTEHFKHKYGTECIAALHHNKRKTNYHIHLIFSERRLMNSPEEKIATRNMFYDQDGNHVRTKKEILDNEGHVIKGCKIISKGNVYERNIFTIKDCRFKSENFLDEVKHSYTDLINIYQSTDKEKLKVFDRQGVYLPTKKIGKNNPKAAQVEADNELRKSWNQTVDRALISGVSEAQIMNVKKTEISQIVKSSKQILGNKPSLFKNIILMAISSLERLISMIFKKSYTNIDNVANTTNKPESETTANSYVFVPKTVEVQPKEKPVPERPLMTILATKYPRLMDVYEKLEQQNNAIYEREKQLFKVRTELDNCKGILNGKRRKELSEQIEQSQKAIENMKMGLSNIVRDYRYKTVKEFMADYTVSKAEYEEFQIAIKQWVKQNGNKEDQDTSFWARSEPNRSR